MNEIFKAKDSIIFENFTDEEIKDFINFFTKKNFSDKSIIFSEGTCGKEFYLIESGTVCITKQVTEESDTVIIRLGRGNFFGELTMFGDVIRTATARAQGDTSVFIISHDDLLEMLHRDSIMAAKFFMNLLKVLGYRLRQTNDSLKDAILWGFNAKE